MDRVVVLSTKQMGTLLMSFRKEDSMSQLARSAAAHLTPLMLWRYSAAATRAPGAVLARRGCPPRAPLRTARRAPPPVCRRRQPALPGPPGGLCHGASPPLATNSDSADSLSCQLSYFRSLGVLTLIRLIVQHYSVAHVLHFVH